jgi:DNA mismatch repair protein MutS
MNNIKDLHVEKELIPLFDFVYNEFARDTLIELLSDLPGSLDEILLRQQIIKGLMANEAIHAPFSYVKSEFNEVYGYLQDLRNRDTQLSETSLKVHLFFSGTERSREGARLSQFIILFCKIHQSYFSRLDEKDFPILFGRKLKNIKQFFSDIGVLEYQVIAKKRRFTIVEISKLTESLQRKIRDGEMDLFWKDFFLFEAYLSVSKGIRKHKFIFPDFNDKGFSIVNFYHPSLKVPVKNSLRAKGNVILITGPNMSGKSTLLKAIGICVLLAHMGLAVPAEQCELPFFDTIAISINLNDDLKSGFSHFMAEIRSLKNIVVEANNAKKCFAVFDELFRGTNIEDALEISKTTILGLTKFTGSFFFISTHLQQLKEMIVRNDDKIDTRFIECKMDNDQPIFTYKLRDGWSDLKIGQLLFEQEGLNQLLSGA